jgi:hypothetical protein
MHAGRAGAEVDQARVVRMRVIRRMMVVIVIVPMLMREMMIVMVMIVGMGMVMIMSFLVAFDAR